MPHDGHAPIEQTGQPSESELLALAVKELLSRSPSSEARFVREAMITARLQHPGIAQIHEALRFIAACGN